MGFRSLPSIDPPGRLALLSTPFRRMRRRSDNDLVARLCLSLSTNTAAAKTKAITTMSVEMETCPASAPFFGFMGVTSALVFANIGAAYGTAKSGVGISSMGVMNPGLVMRNIIPVVMAGVLGIYGLIVAVIIQGSIVSPQNGLSQYSLYTGFAHLAAGLCCGLSGLAAGMAIGIVGDAGVRAVGQQEKLFVGMILILIFAEALGLYGLIVALILSQNSFVCEGNN